MSTNSTHNPPASTQNGSANNESIFAFSHVDFNPIPELAHGRLELVRQIYIHQLVKQLLRRNLGVKALTIAQKYQHLPSFPHMLELLLHSTLEEEATNKDPIPDPLLPRVVAFCQEFDQFLDTVAHCARKTEVALWPHLFNVVGQPKELFENCLLIDSLETAASYLIVLQTMEKPIMSRQHALLLLSASIEKRKWHLADQLIRFLKSIDPQELMSEYSEISDHSVNFFYTSNLIGMANKSPPHHNTSHVQDNLNDIALNLEEVFEVDMSGPGLGRSNNAGNSSASVASLSDRRQSFCKNSKKTGNPLLPLKININPGRTEPICSTVSNKEDNISLINHSDGHPKSKESTISPLLSPNSFEKSCKMNINSIADEVASILHNHARRLISLYRIYELAEFAANTPFTENQFVLWLERERDRACVIVDYDEAMRRVHKDFDWPLAMSQSLQEDNEQHNSIINPDWNGLLQTKKQPSSDSKLRLEYLSDCFERAMCWDWVLVIGLVLSDADRLQKSLKNSSVNISSLPDNNNRPRSGSLTQMRDLPLHKRIPIGLWQIYNWALNDCLTSYVWTLQLLLIKRDTASISEERLRKSRFSRPLSESCIDESIVDHHQNGSLEFTAGKLLSKELVIDTSITDHVLSESSISETDPYDSNLMLLKSSHKSVFVTATDVRIGITGQNLCTLSVETCSDLNSHQNVALINSSANCSNENDSNDPDLTIDKQKYSQSSKSDFPNAKNCQISSVDSNVVFSPGDENQANGCLIQ